MQYNTTPRVLSITHRTNVEAASYLLGQSAAVRDFQWICQAKLVGWECLGRNYRQHWRATGQCATRKLHGDSHDDATSSRASRHRAAYQRGPVSEPGTGG